MTGRRGRRCKQLLNDVTEPTGYWKLKEDALDRILWKTRFGRGTYVCTLVRSTFVELWTLTIQQFTAVHNTLSTRNTEFQNKKKCIQLRYNDITQAGLQYRNLCRTRVNSKDMLWSHILRRSWQWSPLIFCIHGDRRGQTAPAYKLLVLSYCEI